MEAGFKSALPAHRNCLHVGMQLGSTLECTRTMDKLIAKLAPDTALVIYRDAALMHLWQLQNKQVRNWADCSQLRVSAFRRNM